MSTAYGNDNQLLNACFENRVKTHALEVLKNNSVYLACKWDGAGVNVAFTSKPAFKVSTWIEDQDSITP